MNISPLAFIPLSLPDIVWYLYALTLFIFIVHTTLILYHWVKYAINNQARTTFWLLYIAIASFLIACMTLSAFLLL